MARHASTGRLFSTQVEWSVYPNNSLYRRGGARQGACGHNKYQIVRLPGPISSSRFKASATWSALTTIALAFGVPSCVRCWKDLAIGP